MKITLLSLFAIASVSFSSYSQSNALKESTQRGKEIYSDFCVTCHLPNGKGVEKVYPPLANSDYLKKIEKLALKPLNLAYKVKLPLMVKNIIVRWLPWV